MELITAERLRFKNYFSRSVIYGFVHFYEVVGKRFRSADKYCKFKIGHNMSLFTKKKKNVILRGSYHRKGFNEFPVQLLLKHGPY